ncbi:MAG: M48 family metalloprotease [Candidatus Omnitrophica bacterium]|nr:M48 family metalloprotease [Candidatus Omnitrophota bacterium]
MRKYILAIIFFSVLWGGCVAMYNPATQQREYYFIGESAEVRLGRNMAEKIRREQELSSDQSLVRRVRRIGEQVAGVSDRSDIQYHFSVLDDETLNAFALPGGYIFVHDGLVKKSTDAELAFVLGHEIGHVAARHSLKRLQAVVGFQLFSALAFAEKDHESLRRAVNAVYQLVALGYSRQDELSADSLGVEYATAAGFPAQGAVSFFRKLQREANPSPQFEMLQSHPDIETRIRRIQERRGAE